MTSSPLNEPRRKVARGFLRSYVVLWALWAFYWVLIWPFREAFNDGIPITAFYSDAFSEIGYAAALAAIFLIAIPLLLLGFIAAMSLAVQWVIRGFEPQTGRSSRKGARIN